MAESQAPQAAVDHLGPIDKDRVDIEDINILVVDDEKVARKVVRRCLMNAGYSEDKIIDVDSGQKALQELEQRRFHMVLCDVLMPDIDGLELLTRIRKMEDCKQIPVIMVSASEDLGTVYKCLQAGADDYIIKPVRSSMLRNLWSNIWRKKKEREVLDQLRKEKESSTQKDIELRDLSGKLQDMHQKVNEAVTTPITVIIRTISELTNNHNLTDEVHKALSTIVKELGSSDLYRPAFNKLLHSEVSEDGFPADLDPMTRLWLRREYGHEGQYEDLNKLPTGKTSSNSLASEEPSAAEAQPGEEVEPLALPGDICQALAKYDFDLWAYMEDELLPFFEYFFDYFDLFEKFHIKRSDFRNFVAQARAGYISSNPYHNFRHAFDVTHGIFTLLTTGRAAEILTPLEIFSLLTSAITHDLSHPGLNSAFLIAIQDDLAVTYNDQSVLENFHTAQTFKVLKKANILSGLTPKEFRDFRRFVIKNILATDMARHMEIYNRLEATISQFSPENADHRLLLMQVLMKASDISNPAKPFSICRYWAELVQEEFFKQGDKEKELNMPPSPFMDRENNNLPKMQIGFADFFVVPLFTSLLKILPATLPLVDQLHLNRKTWDKLSKEAESLAE